MSEGECGVEMGILLFGNAGFVWLNLSDIYIYQEVHSQRSVKRDTNKIYDQSSVFTGC